MGNYTLFVTVLLAAAITEAAKAQSMCVPDPVEIDSIEGAVLFEVGEKSAPLADVTVSISPYAQPDVPPVAKFVTGGDGRFVIESVAPGRYWLAFRHAALIGFTLELRLRQRARRPSGFILASIRNDPNKPCGGGSVNLSPVLEDSCRSLEYQNQNQRDYALKLRRIEGTVKDMQSPPSLMSRTCVGLFTEDGRKLLMTAESNRRGTFALGTVPSGEYRLVAKLPGFGVANVILKVGTWPSGGILNTRHLFVHLLPRGVDATSFVNFER